MISAGPPVPSSSSRPGQLVRAYGLTIRLAPLLSSAALSRSRSGQLSVTASSAACGSGAFKVSTLQVETSGLFGTLEDGARFVEKLAAIGVDDVACLIDFGVPAAEVLNGLRLLDELRRLRMT